jgi:hypothetical protein
MEDMGIFMPTIMATCAAPRVNWVFFPCLPHVSDSQIIRMAPLPFTQCGRYLIMITDKSLISLFNSKYYLFSQGKYIRGQANSYQSTTYFTFSTDQSKFVLHYDHQQRNKQPGILVDIYSLANGFFLSVVAVGNQQNYQYVVAKSRTALAKKFLLVPVE